ncbi:unnamed protein product, partial [marine sediment metagenome]
LSPYRHDFILAENIRSPQPIYRFGKYNPQDFMR